MMKMTFLGTGTSCGIPQPGCHCPVCTSQDSRDKRLRCSALFESGDVRILMDCGPDFREQMLRINWDKPFDAVFITHEHTDHVSFLPTFIKKTGASLYIHKNTFESNSEHA